MVMKRYSNSSIYPISQASIESIAVNMKENGFEPNYPILVKDGGIVDGWHRYQAALRAEVELVGLDFDGDDTDALLHIMRANGDRRHLNEGQKAAAAVKINRKLGKDAKAIAEVARNTGVNEATANRFTGYSDDDLEDILTGKKSQKDVKESKTRKSTRQSTTYTLTARQSGKVANLTVVMDTSGKKLLPRAFDLGLKALEEESALANGK